jgi:hypothetical protein
MSLEFFETLLRRYRGKGLLVDTNVLLLLLVGSIDPKIIGDFKITANQGFTETDYETLQNLIKNFQKVVTTPHILAEVSNHADKFKSESHQRIFSKFISLIDLLEEHFESAKALARSDAFVRFGLTDTAISMLAAKKFLVLTVDLSLAGYLKKKGVDAINFNNLRLS